MGELLQRFVDFLREFWPLRTVMQWEAANIYRMGRYWKTVEPGMYFVVPFFWELKTEQVLRSTYVTALQSIETLDGGTLTFSATLQVEVEDVHAAQLKVHDYAETAIEDASALLADYLMRVKSARLDSDARVALLLSCRNAVAKELGAYGLRVVTLRFNNFVRNMRVYRLFNDQAYTSHN